MNNKAASPARTIRVCRRVGHKRKMPPQGRESIPQPLSLPRGTQGIKLPLHAVLFKKNGKRLTLLCSTREKTAPRRTTTMQNNKFKKI